MSKSTAPSLNKIWETGSCYSQREEQKPRANSQNCRLISRQLVIVLKDKHIRATWLELFSVWMIPHGWLMSECALVSPRWGRSCEEAHRNILLTELFSAQLLPKSPVRGLVPTPRPLENKAKGLHLLLFCFMSPQSWEGSRSTLLKRATVSQ